MLHENALSVTLVPSSASKEPDVTVVASALILVVPPGEVLKGLLKEIVAAL